MEIEMKSQLETIIKRIEQTKQHIGTEEATKTAFILPFIQALGYDVFNPSEVIPEFTADIGLKKGEKVDFAVMQKGQPIIILECKSWQEDLDNHKSQLHRYFHVSNTRFGVLTNGIVYRFFSDLEKNNIMDSKPFLEVNLEDLRENNLQELRKFHKSQFDVNHIVNSASDLKYIKAIKDVFSTQINNPDQDLVRFYANKVYDGRLTEKIMEQFSGITKKAISQVISETVNDRLKSALEKETVAQVEEIVQAEPDSKIETTEEEIEGFHIVKSLLRKVIDPNRIHHRDTQSYFGILLDNNNRKPICRLWFNGVQKYIGLFNENKEEERIAINELNDIYEFTEAICERVKGYEE